jgi:hypothetical protein
VPRSYWTGRRECSKLLDIAGSFRIQPNRKKGIKSLQYGYV